MKESSDVRLQSSVVGRQPQDMVVGLRTCLEIPGELVRMPHLTRSRRIALADPELCGGHLYGAEAIRSDNTRRPYQRCLSRNQCVSPSLSASATLLLRDFPTGKAP